MKRDDIDDKKKKVLIIKNKVSSIAKMSRMFSTLREESEMLLQIKNISPDGKLPRGILMQGKPAIKNGKDCGSQEAPGRRAGEERLLPTRPTR